MDDLASLISSEIDRHYRTHLGNPLPDQLQAIVPGEPQLAISIYRSTDCFVLATNGVSQCHLNAPNDQPYTRHAELTMQLPLDWLIDEMMKQNEDWAWPVNWMLRILSEHIAQQRWFGRGDMIEDLSALPDFQLPAHLEYSSCLYLKEGYPFGYVDIPNNYKVSIYTLFPLYREEQVYAQTNGIQSLLLAFRDKGLPTTVSQLRSYAVY
jgi:uncharacterized protein